MGSLQINQISSLGVVCVFVERPRGFCEYHDAGIVRHALTYFLIHAESSWSTWLRSLWGILRNRGDL